ncbi:hypothetical protein [Nonomuraea africana]|uniref:YggT family protein n=1 Tax=Nonomuraea africana TaxID=46171 RepID=A0ABR9KP18_9ACTN|nr:hypothetical protein [Nonomuraea africana]MBE1563769.1 hypothetical protein [Nonomuraea africana]
MAETRPHRPAVRTAPTVWQRAAAIAVWAVKVFTRSVALVMALYIAFRIFPANPANALVQFVESVATTLSLGLSDLFRLADARWQVLVNYGLAAVVWLALGSAVASLIRRVSP